MYIADLIIHSYLLFLLHTLALGDLPSCLSFFSQVTLGGPTAEGRAEMTGSNSSRSLKSAYPRKSCACIVSYI